MPRQLVMEYIVASAVLYPNGDVGIGQRHIDACRWLGRTNECIDGFWTNKRRFIDRKEGWDVAQAAGQIKYYLPGELPEKGIHYNEGHLDSFNLFSPYDDEELREKFEV